MRRRSVLLPLALVLAASCTSRFPPLDLSALPDDPAFHDDGAVSLDASERIVFGIDPDDGEPTALVDRRSRVRILEERGRAAAKVYVGYEPGLIDLRALEARATAPDGTVRTMGLDNAVDIATYPGFVLYADDRASILDFSPVELGTVIDSHSAVLHHKAETSRFAFGFGGGWTELHDRLEVFVPEGWEVAWHVTERGREVPWPPQRTKVHGGTRLVWEAKNLASRSWEPYAPPTRFQERVVEVQPRRWKVGGAVHEGLADAAALSAYLAKELLPKDPPAPAVAAMASTLLEGAPDDVRARARRLAEWVRDNVQYCAIEIGEGGWRPHAPARVLDLRYGDCKDKARLLHELLRAAKIESRLTLVSAHGGWPPRLGLPAIGGTFNHVILTIDLPGGPLVFDPTARWTAFGTTPVAIQGSDMLTVEVPGAGIVRAPELGPEASKGRLELDLALDGHGALEGTFVYEGGGYRADDARAGLGPTTGDDRLKAAAEVLGLHRGKVLALDVDRPSPSDGPTVGLHGRARLGESLASAGSARLLSATALVDTPLPSLGCEKRDLPVVLRQRHTDTLHATVALPREMRASTLPAPVEISTDAGRYMLTWKVEDGRLTLDRTLTLKERIFPENAWPEACRFFEAVHEAESRSVVLMAR